MNNQPRSILAIDASPFGRSISLLAAARSLRTAFGQAFIAVATSTGTCELLAAAGLVDETIDLGVIKNIEGAGAGAQALKNLARLLRRARKNFDLVLDFSPRVETQVLSRLVVKARTVTPSRRPSLIDILLGGARRDAGPTADYESVLRQIGIGQSDGRLAFRLKAEENAQFEKMLERKGSRGGEPIVVFYSAGAVREAWPVESFGEMANRLANNFGARVIAADEPSDNSFTKAIGAALPQTAIKLESPSATGLAAAVARASLLITDEPGLARLASEMGTPALEIAEARDVANTAESHRVVRGSSRARVSPDDVYEIASEMLQDSRSASLFRN